MAGRGASLTGARMYSVDDTMVFAAKGTHSDDDGA